MVLLLRIWVLLVALLAVWAVDAERLPARAQQVILPVDQLAAALFAETGEPALVINGDTAGHAGFSDDEQTRVYGFYKPVLALIAHRLIDRGDMALDDAVRQRLPELIEIDPFRKPVTVAHLLSETGGYAVPPWYDDKALSRHMKPVPFKRYLIPLRSAGRMAQDDPVGWVLLLRHMERVSGLSLPALIKREVTGPLSLSDNFFEKSTDCNAPDPFDALLCGGISVDDLAIMLRRMLRNKKGDGAAYLSPNSLKLLFKSDQWVFHPFHLGVSQTTYCA